MHDMGITSERVPLEDVRLGDWDFWGRPHDWRDAAFATLRRESPVAFFPEMEFPGSASGKGFWALTRHGDILHASRNPQLFSSYPSMAIQDSSPEAAEYLGTSMICLDDPHHGRLRRIVERSSRSRQTVPVLAPVAAPRTTGLAVGLAISAFIEYSVT